jgi:hypothetical protein
VNCKPNDLAIVTGAESGDDYAGVASRLCLGRIVRVAKLCSDGVWDFEEGIDLGRIHFIYEGMKASATVIVYGLPDSFLCPISGVPVTDEVTEDLKEPVCN